MMGSSSWLTTDTQPHLTSTDNPFVVAAGNRYRILRGCVGKVAYATAQAAGAKRTRAGEKTYFCGNCKWYHNGTLRGVW